MKQKTYDVVKGLISYQSRFLLVESNEFSGGKYEVPGGRKHPSEDDETALRREIFEEVGLEVTVVRLLNTWLVSLPKKGLRLNGKTYLCEAASDKVQLSPEQKSHLWVAAEKLAYYDLPKWLQYGIRILGYSSRTRK